jgi:sugar lactone lactonase YvrE
MTYATYVVVTGLVFPETPRWHLGRFWFTDQFSGRLMRLSLDGTLETIATLPDHIGGLGWLPDGSLLTLGMTQRRLYRLGAAGFEPYTDLSGLAAHDCNDLLVDSGGGAYVGNFGFDLRGGAPTVSTRLIRVGPNGQAWAVGGPLIFPNGMAMSPEGDLLLVAETFAHRVSSFRVAPGGELSDHRTWADLRAATPDGICLDAEGALWIASPMTRELMRVRQGGEIVDRVKTFGAPYACMLGGPDRRILYVCTAETHDPDHATANPSGRIEVVNVVVPGAGLP